MSGSEHRTGQARQIHLMRRAEHPQPAGSPGGLNGAKYRLEQHQLLHQAVESNNGQMASMTQRGKRKSFSVDDDQDLAQDRHGAAHHSYHMNPRSLPPVVSTGQSKKRSKIQPKSRANPPELIAPIQDYMSQAFVERPTNATYQPPILCCANDGLTPDSCRISPQCGHASGHVNASEFAMDGRMSSRYGERLAHVHHQQGAAAADLAASTLLPAPPPCSRSGWPHSLSELHWPFDDILYDYGTKRGGGGGGSQPSTTGSQGFPHFVTAGPDMSLFGDSLFGYDRSELMGCISWA